MYAVIRNLAAFSCAAAGVLSLASQTHADTPPGWISSNITSAYTLDSSDFEISAAALAVNSKLDVFNVRDDLIAGNRRLIGDSGDLNGTGVDLRFGLGSMFTLFYRQHEHELELEMAPQSRVDLTDIDSELSTTAKAYGIKWNFYEAGRRGNTPWHAASFELTRVESESDPFQATINRVQIGNGTEIFLDPPQVFQVDNLEDEGWIGKLIYSLPIANSIAISTWLGYASMDASSGTSSQIETSFIRDAFQQSFRADETQYLAGVSVNWQLTARMPLQLNYEYINIDQEMTIEQSSANSILPSFLRASNLGDAEDNHIVSGSLSYWLTPRLNLGLQARVFSNQFLGVMPHYNNPLSGAFSDTLYGYASVQLGYRL